MALSDWITKFEYVKPSESANPLERTQEQHTIFPVTPAVREHGFAWFSSSKRKEFKVAPDAVPPWAAHMHVTTEVLLRTMLIKDEPTWSAMDPMDILRRSTAYKISEYCARINGETVTWCPEGECDASARRAPGDFLFEGYHTLGDGTLVLGYSPFKQE